MGTPLFACPGTSLRHSLYPATIARVRKRLVSWEGGSGLDWPVFCLPGSNANPEGTAHSWDRGPWSLQERSGDQDGGVSHSWQEVCPLLCVPSPLLPRHLFFQSQSGAKRQGVMASLSTVLCSGFCPCVPPIHDLISPPAALGSLLLSQGLFIPPPPSAPESAAL